MYTLNQTELNHINGGGMGNALLVSAAVVGIITFGIWLTHSDSDCGYFQVFSPYGDGFRVDREYRCVPK